MTAHFSRRETRRSWAALSVVLCLPLVARANIYLGPGESITRTLVWSETTSQIVATASWRDSQTTITSTVTRPDEGGSLTYSYTFTAAKKDLSHLIIEVSDADPDGLDAFTLDNLMDFENTAGYVLHGTHPQVEVGHFEPTDGKPNPNMPAPMYGMKFDDLFGDADAWTLSFKSHRLPMEGDFFAADGRDGDIWVTAWNADFGMVGVDRLDSGPTKIFVPNASYAAPVPGAVLLGILGLTAAGAILRRSG